MKSKEKEQLNIDKFLSKIIEISTIVAILTEAVQSCLDIINKRRK